MSLYTILGHRYIFLMVYNKVTNSKVDRKSVYSDKEINGMIETANSLDEYEKLRAKCLIALFRSGKRRAEVASLEIDDLQVKGNYLHITFTVVKKRKKNVNVRRRTKRYHINGYLAQMILKYLEHVKKEHSKCKYLFPSRKNVFGQA